MILLKHNYWSTGVIYIISSKGQEGVRSPHIMVQLILGDYIWVIWKQLSCGSFVAE